MLLVNTLPLEGQRTEMSRDTTIRVVLADDHEVIRKGLKRLLDRAPEIEVVGEASDGLEAIQCVEELAPDVLLLDIEMPLMDGIEVARRLHDSGVEVQILILSAYDDHEYIRALLDLGVSGYLVKGEAPGKLVEAVRGIAKGQVGWVGPQVRKKLEKMRDSPTKQDTLTLHDLQILRYLTMGKTEEEIAEKMKIDHQELEKAIDRLMEQLDADSKAQAIDIAINKGWIQR